MLLSNLPFIPDREFDVIGIVKGNVAVAAETEKKRIPASIGGMFKRDKTEYLNAVMDSVVTGKPQAPGKKESAGYAETLKDARQSATNMMINEAVALSADAVINIKYETSCLACGTAEVLAYGTAVKFR